MCAVQVNNFSTLLYGPGKAFFGSALAGTAASLALSPLHPAACSSYYRPPYDDDIWQAGNSFHDDIQLPFRGQPEVAKVAKAKRPVGWTALKQIAGAKNVILTLARNEALSCVLVLHGYFEALSAEEDLALAEDREPRHVQFPEAQFKAAARKGFVNACLDWATQVVRSLLDWAASQRLSTHLSAKLVKDLRASVQRKLKHPFYTRGLRVFKTSLHSETTLYLADFVVSSAMECYRACCAFKGSWQPALRQLGLRCALHSARCSAVLLATSAANGLGSMSPYKRSFTMFLLAQLSAFAVNSAFFSLTLRLAGAPPPPPAAPPGQAGAVEAAVAEGAGPAVVDPLMMVNAQMPRGGAAAAAQAAVQVGGAAAVAGLAAHVAGGAADGDEADEQPQQQAQQRQQAAWQDVGVQADAPPEPVPQQRRRVVGGPRLPDRPARRHAGMVGPPPQAPHTPQFREPRAPSPAPDSEDVELSRAADAGAAANAPSPGAPSSQEEQEGGSDQGSGRERSVHAVQNSARASSREPEDQSGLIFGAEAGEPPEQVPQ